MPNKSSSPGSITKKRSRINGSGGFRRLKLSQILYQKPKLGSDLKLRLFKIYFLNLLIKRTTRGWRWRGRRGSRARCGRARNLLEVIEESVLGGAHLAAGQPQARSERLWKAVRENFESFSSQKIVQEGKNKNIWLRSKTKKLSQICRCLWQNLDP